MGTETVVLIKLVLIVGLLVGVCVHQLRSVKRDRDNDRAARPAPPGATAHRSDERP